MNDSRTALARLGRGAAWGALAGLLAAALDVASTVLWLSSPDDQRKLVVALVLVCVGASALASVAFFALVGREIERGRNRSQIVRLAALSIAPGALVGWMLFTGGRMRRMPALFALKPIAALLCAAIFTAGLALLARVTERLLREKPARRAAGASVFVALSMAAHALDHRLFPRLYEYLHGVLGVATGAFALCAAALVWPRPSRRARALALALAAPSLVVGLVALSRWDNVRAEVFGTHAPYARHIAVAAEFASRRAQPAPTSALLDRERLERERAALARESDPSLPRVVGAHVLLVTVDAMRADRLSLERTPRLFSLAERAVRFDRAYAQAPHSSYSITTLHTGEFLHETVQLGQRQPLPTIASTLAAHGYRTAAIYTNGIFFTEGERLEPYRDRHLDFSRAEHRDLDARETTDVALRELDESVRRGEPPTFLWAHYFDAHEPYRGQGPTPIARYDAALATVDREVDRLLSSARARLRRPIVFVLAADHGEEFGEHGGVYHGSALYEEQVRVPFVVMADGIAPRRVDRPVGLVDVAPTILSLVGVARPPSARGRDLRPWMVGREGPIEPVFSAVNTRLMALRWPLKLVRDMRWSTRELYDLEADPSERASLASARPGDVTELEGELQSWLSSLGRGAANADVGLARMGDRGAAERLVRLALDERADERARVDAIDAVGSLRDRLIVSRLAPLVRSARRSIALAAAVASGLAGERPEGTVETLLEYVCNDSYELRVRSAFALATLGHSGAEPALIEALRAGDESDRLRALDGLTRVPLAARTRSLRAEAAVLEAIEDDHLRYRAALALGAVSGSGALATLTRLAREDRADDVRAWAVAGLGLTGDPRAAGVIVERMSADAAAQSFAASALGLLGHGRGANAWDARDATGGPWVECGAVDDRAPWVELGARACRAQGRVVVSLRLGEGRRFDVRLRAKGDAPLVVRVGGREVLRFSLESSMREWRATVTDAPAGEWVLESERAFWLGHVRATAQGATSAR